MSSVMKYDSLRKTERNKALAEYCKEHQGLSLREIGEVFGISAQAVWRIKKNHKNTELVKEG